LFFVLVVFLEFLLSGRFVFVFVYSLRSSEPKEETDGHEDAASGDPRTFSLANSSALPESAQKSRFILVQKGWENRPDISTRANEEQNDDE